MNRYGFFDVEFRRGDKLRLGSGRLSNGRLGIIAGDEYFLSADKVRR